MDDVMDSGEIAIYNQSGELRMTKVSSKKHLNNENILFEKDPGSKLSVSLNNSEDFDLPKENGYNNEDWEEIAENKNVQTNMNYNEEFCAGSQLLNASQISGQLNASGIITEMNVPDLVTEENTKPVKLTEEQIKEEFMKKNYQSNFSMGGGYGDIDDGEKKYLEFQKKMNQ